VFFSALFLDIDVRRTRRLLRGYITVKAGVICCVNDGISAENNRKKQVLRVINNTD